jgi:hypothetical protein
MVAVVSQPFQESLQQRLANYLQGLLAGCCSAGPGTADELVPKVWEEFSSREVESRKQAEAGFASVWRALRRAARNQVLFYRCRCLVEPPGESAAAPSGQDGRRRLTADERAGLCYFLSRGQVGRESDWNDLFNSVRRPLCGYIASILQVHHFLDPDRVEDIFERVMVAFCARNPERLLPLVERLGSLFRFLRRLARDQLWQFEHQEQLHRKREAAVAHRRDEPAPVTLSQASLRRILKDMDVWLPRQHVQWLRDHLGRGQHAADKIALTDVERKHLQRLVKDVRDYMDRRWVFAQL